MGRIPARRLGRRPVALQRGDEDRKPAGVPEHFADLGWRVGDVTALACVEIVCTLLYLVPRTQVLGAILLTGYLGGAIATHVRIADGVFPYPLLLGITLWGSLWLRAPRERAQVRGLRGLIPFVV